MRRRRIDATCLCQKRLNSAMRDLIFVKRGLICAKRDLIEED